MKILAPRKPQSTTEVPPPPAAEVSSPADDPEYVPPTPNPRNAVLASLHKRSLAETGSEEADLVPLNEEAGGFNPQSLLVDPAPDEDRERMKAALAGVNDGEEVPPVEIPPVEEVPPATPKIYKTIVKGQEVEVDEQAVVEAGLHAIRHRGAAEAALREASELLAAARQHKATAEPDPAPAAPNADALAMAEAIQNGTREDAARAIAALLERGADSGQVENMVAQQVETRIRDKTDQDKAAADLEKLVPEVLSDANVVRILAIEERALRAAGDRRPYSQIYPEIGNKVRGWLDGLKGPSAAPGGTVEATLQDRAAAKRATPAPVAGNSARQPAAPQPKGQTGSDIVQRMRTARGQVNRI